ncbi:MAG: hypothetical protein ACREFE_20540 [Limisphaerales bacterium]
MNRHSKKIVRAARIIFALTGIFLTQPLGAQTAMVHVDNRFLLIFDTASDMKKRVPAEQKALDTILATSVNGQLHSGDSIGVWTFDRELRTGQFPLQYWNSENAAVIAAKITTFIGRQRYAKKTRFNSLQPLLNQVIKNSERLTILIFCDGEDAFSGTPFEAGINQVFQRNGAAQKKARQPFAVALRTQLGQYVGCMVSCPPLMQVKLPEFPPLPLPPKPKPVSPPPPPQSPMVIEPPLIIVGTNVTNHVPPLAPPKMVLSNPPPTIATSVSPAMVSLNPNTNSPLKISKGANERH